MRIAMFSWEALEGIAVGGGAVYASNLASALARLGHHVRLFTRQGPGQPMDEIVRRVHIRRCPWDRKPNFVDEMDSLSHAFAHYFADALKADGGYDIVHCHEWLTAAAGRRALALSPDSRLAASFHSTEWGRTGVWPDAGDSARIARLEREGLETAHAVAAASQWARRTIHDQFHPPDWKCGLVYHGTDLPPRSGADGDGGGGVVAKRVREAAGIFPGTPSFLFAGRFSRAGGGDLAARAARLVSARFPAAKFLFVGAGPLEEEMRREAGKNALFIPLQGRVVPAEFYHAANLVLAPFRRDHNGRAVLPAWAAGKPAVVLEGTVPSEFVAPGVNGWTVPADAERVAGVVMDAFADPEMTDWLGRNGRVAAETAFSWDESAKRLLSLYGVRDRLTPVGENEAS